MLEEGFVLTIQEIRISEPVICHPTPLFPGREGENLPGSSGGCVRRLGAMHRAVVEKGVEVRSVLILHQGALGDFILALPSLASLRRTFPDARFVLVGYPRILELVEKRFYADEIYSVDQKGMASFFVQGGALDRGLSGFFASFDLIVVFGKGGGTTISENLKRVSRGTLLQVNSFPPWDEGIHLSDHLLSELTRHGIGIGERVPRLYLNESDRAWARLFWDRQGVPSLERRETILLHPGSGSRKKVWPIERFLEIADHLGKRIRKRVLVVIGPAEAGETERRFQAVAAPPTILVKGLSLLQLASVMEGCGAFVGNDSGVSHLAAALGVPTLAIFGPTDPRMWSPRGERVLVLHRRISCSPCPPERFLRCSRSECLEQIKPADVFEGLRRLGIPLREKGEP